MHSRTAPILLALLLLSPAAARAQEASPACAIVDVVLPQPFAGWPPEANVGSAARGADLPAAGLAPGQAVRAALHPTPEIAYLVPPSKPAAPASQGGMLALTITQAGVYALAAGSSAWIDVLDGQTAVPSTAHGHGPPCSSIHKVVDFPLHPGRYVIQISGAPDPVVAIMVVRRP